MTGKPGELELIRGPRCLMRCARSALTGQEGCDHGHCGAAPFLVADGGLTPAYLGRHAPRFEITTIEGLARQRKCIRCSCIRECDGYHAATALQARSVPRRELAELKAASHHVTGSQCAAARSKRRCATHERQHRRCGAYSNIPTVKSRREARMRPSLSSAHAPRPTPRGRGATPGAKFGPAAPSSRPDDSLEIETPTHSSPEWSRVDKIESTPDGGLRSARWCATRSARPMSECGAIRRSLAGAAWPARPEQLRNKCPHRRQSASRTPALFLLHQTCRATTHFPMAQRDRCFTRQTAVSSSATRASPRIRAILPSRCACSMRPWNAHAWCDAQIPIAEFFDARLSTADRYRACAGELITACAAQAGGRPRNSTTNSRPC